VSWSITIAGRDTGLRGLIVTLGDRPRSDPFSLGTSATLAMQMDVEIGGRAKRWMRVTAKVAASVRLSPTCWIRNVEITRWTTCNMGMCTQLARRSFSRNSITSSSASGSTGRSSAAAGILLSRGRSTIRATSFAKLLFYAAMLSVLQLAFVALAGAGRCATLRGMSWTRRCGWSRRIGGVG
jgi:hypothetical protein